MGVPQYRWREMPQSLRRYCTVRSPIPRASAAADIFAIASSTDRPVNSPEFTSTPGPSYASDIGSLVCPADAVASGPPADGVAPAPPVDAVAPKPPAEVEAEADPPAGGVTTRVIGRLYFRAN